jgi:uncharacterized RDD family membrane protein YckC
VNTAEPHDPAATGTDPAPVRPLMAVPEVGPPPQAAVPHEHRATIPPRALAYQGRRAGLVTRTVASTIDAIVVGVLLTVVYLGLVAFTFVLKPQSFSWPAPSAVFALAGYLGMAVVYLTASWATTGRTYGDHVMGLRVVNFRGRRMRWAGAFVRAMSCTLFPIGLAWVVVSPQNRSLQDVVLRTSVVYDWREGAEREIRP